MRLLILSLFLAFSSAQAKEISLTFDDAPMSKSKHFDTFARTDELIKNLKALDIPPVMIFANPCKRADSASVVIQLKKYTDAGHLIANHTCSHPRLDEAGYAEYVKDATKADEILSPLFIGPKFFRYPFLNEGNDEKLRDQVRKWLTENHYRNGMVSIDNDDYIFSSKINEAKAKGKTIDYTKVQKLFIEHIVGAVNFYDALAIKTIGYSPKHVLLLHEMDATVMFIRPLIEELRKHGWKFIGTNEAYKDKIYLEQPKNTYSDNGIVAQLATEKTGERLSYNSDTLKTELNKILGLE